MENKSYYHSAYNINFQSYIELEELLPIHSQADVLIHVKKNEYDPLEKKKQWHFEVNKDHAILHFKNIAKFILSNGQEIIVLPAPYADNRSIQQYLIGTVMAVLLYQRGHLVLHASAININGLAVAFMGETNYGKSSLAALLNSEGYSVLSDDVTALSKVKNIKKFMTLPGFPYVKISSEIAEYLNFKSGTRLAYKSLKNKNILRVKNNFSKQPVPLNHVYILGESPSIDIFPMSKRDAFVEIIKNSYPTRMYQSGGVDHFNLCSDMANNISFFKLTFPRSINALQDIGRAIKNHIRIC
jgi:hypothetical protein